MINAIVNSGITSLNNIDLRCNGHWFADSEATTYLFDFIEQQTCLESIDLTNNNFSSATTTQLFTTLLASNSVNTITDLVLTSSCNFISDETCALLANFIDKAPKIKVCAIGHYGSVNGKTNREITVVLELAKEGDESSKS